MATTNGEGDVQHTEDVQQIKSEDDQQIKTEDVQQTEDAQPTEDVQHTEDYQKLIDYGINSEVASELDSIFVKGILQHSDLDERALDALKEFPATNGVAVLKNFCDANLEHVANKSAYLCGVMKTYRMRMKQPGATDATPKGPDEAKLKEILERTGYALDVTTGQRKYGGPPPGCDAEDQPGKGHEVFCGQVPKDLFEDELIPLFEQAGKIWDLRLMMNPLTGLNRGYAFVTFCDTKSAAEACSLFNGHEIKPGKKLKVNVSVANVRLFVGNIPKSKGKEEILEEFKQHTPGLEEVIIYSSADDPKKKNRGFAFLEYESHKNASNAKRKLSTGRVRVWGCDIIVDWADPQSEPDTDTMEKVKVLYVKNLKADVTEEQLKEKFEEYGKVERVKKIKDYGFVHFEERDPAVKALEALNGEALGESVLEISLAKPPGDNKKKEQRRQQRHGGMMGGPGFGGPGRGMRGGPRGRGHPADFYGYGYGGGFADYGGYGDPYYDDYYGGYDDDFGYGFGMPRGRGMMRGGPPMRGPMRGRPGRGRGSRGMPGRGGPGGRGGRGSPAAGARGGKRKAGGDGNLSAAKRRGGVQDWGAQPIAQQPLPDSSSQEWYTDDFQQWS